MAVKQPLALHSSPYQCKERVVKYIRAEKIFRAAIFSIALSGQGTGSRHILAAAIGLEGARMEPDDETLVLACRRGDESAWESLVMRYQRLIISIPRRAGLDEDSCSDVFQNVFASLIERLDRIEQPDRIQAWLVTTARRETWRVILHRKAQRASTAAADDEADEFDRIPDDAPLADEVIIELEKQHQIRAALESIDERCRKLIELLFYSEDAPAYSEIASILGVREGSIGPTRARCLQKLLQVLRKMEI